MQNQFKYKLSIVAIMKYEEPYVLEWVAYHHSIGVDHFYIYDNDEKSNMKKVLQKYIDAGIVTLNYAPGQVMMFRCYNSAIENYREESKYIAFIDADEFLVPIEDVNVADLVDTMLTQFRSTNPSVGGLAVKWAVYGSGNRLNKPRGLMIQSYLYKENGDMDKHVKNIVDPRVVKAWSNPHFPSYMDYKMSVDETGLRSFGPFMYADNRSKIRINHYYYKSEKEFMNRIRRGKCDIYATEEQMIAKVNSELENLRNSNNEYDDLMLRYVGRVKAEMEKYKND